MPYQRITNFTGGLNVLVDPRRLSPNSDKEGMAESPEMENMSITQEGALITSTGFERVAGALQISNLVGSWKFDEGSGVTANDSSTNSNNGAITGATYVTGIFNDALTFDGASGDVQVPDNAVLQNIFDGGGSISVWVNPNSDGESDAGWIVAKDNGNGWGLTVNSESGGFMKIRFFQRFDTSATTYDTTSADLPINSWSHIVVTYDNGAPANAPVIYVNGVSVAVTNSATGTGTRKDDTGEILFIGNIGSGADNRTWDGEIDEVLLFDDTLTTDEITLLNNNAGAPILAATEKVKGLLNYEKNEDDRFLIATIGDSHYSITPTVTVLDAEFLGDYGTEATYVGGTVYAGSSATRRAILGNDITANDPQKADKSSAMAALAGTPPDGYIMATFMGRLFIADGITLYYTSVEDEDDFAGGGTIKFNDLITGLSVEGDRLIVFTRTYHQGVMFNYDDSFNLSVPLKEPYERKYGALGFKSVQNVYPDVFYWADEGIMRLGAELSYDADGIPRPQSVSRKIDPALDLANKAFRIDAAGAQFKQQYFLSIPVGTDNFNSKTYVFNLNWKAWTLRTGIYPTAFELFRDANYKQELYFGGFFAPEVYKFNDSYSYNGFGYTRKWKSKKFVHGDSNAMKKWRWIDITGSMDSSTTFDVTIQVDNNKKKYQIDNTHLEIDAFGEYIGDNFLGDAFLGGAEPEETRFKRFRARIPINSDIREGYEMQLTLENAGDEQPWKIDFIGIEYDYLPRTQILSKYINNSPLST